MNRNKAEAESNHQGEQFVATKDIPSCIIHQLHNLTVQATAWAQNFSLALTSSGWSPGSMKEGKDERSYFRCHPMK